MSYNRYGRTYRAPLTPPAELVERHVTWRPKRADGGRNSAVRGYVTGYDADARTLTIEVRQETSMWQPDPTRTVTIPLAHGPFTLC